MAKWQGHNCQQQSHFLMYTVTGASQWNEIEKKQNLWSHGSKQAPLCSNVYHQ